MMHTAVPDRHRPSSAQPAPAVLRRCSCGAQAGGGECAECRRKRLALRRSPARIDATPLLQRQEGGKAPPCGAERAKEAARTGGAGPETARTREDATIRRAPLASCSASRSGETAPSIVEEALSRTGAPLPDAVRVNMERHFAHDFGRVRVHTDRVAADSADAVAARAYTVGNRLVFGAGEYAPHTPRGLRLLAHELTHVVQQASADSPAAVNGAIAVGRADDPLEREAEASAARVTSHLPDDGSGRALAPESVADSPSLRAAPANPWKGESRCLQRAVRPENVSCRNTGLRNPDLSGADAVKAIEDADTEAIALARRAQHSLDFHLLFTQAGDPIDAEFDTILQEELGLTLANAAHHPLIEQQRDRFRRVAETLESGYLRYMCRGGTVSLVGCQQGTCGDNFAFTCPGNRLVVLCQRFWDTPAERGATLLHEPFHIWFHMAEHDPGALRRADASCFESFAMRIAGQPAPASCVGHTNG